MYKLVRASLAAALFAVVAAPGHAAGLSVSAIGSQLPFFPADGTSYLEVWGVGSNSRYALPATDPGDAYHPLISGLEQASQALLSRYGFAFADWTYDPAAAPLSVSASGNTARYAMGPLTVQLAGNGPLAAISTADTQLVVSRSSNRHTQLVRFTYPLPTVDGPLPGSTFSYPVPGGATTPVDLVSLLGPTAYYVNGFDLGAFSSLPVRLTAPALMRPVQIEVAFGRTNASVEFGVAPPATLSLADFDSATISATFDGVFGVSVDPADFDSNDAYLAAQDWVQANIRQINYEGTANWAVGSLQTAPVPEPATAWLWMAGAAGLGVFARRRQG